MNGYAELHCVSNFTFLRGASRPEELVRQARKWGYSALALTDECSMAGMVRAHEAAKEHQLKLIVGSEFHTRDDFHVVLLAPSQRAYSQICRLITLGRRRSPKGEYQLVRADFQTGLEDCLALWLPPSPPLVSQAGWMRELFPGRCWIAAELHREAGDAQHAAALQQISRHTGLPMVAAGNVHMHVRERRPLQDTLTAIRHGCTLAEAGHRLFANGERHLRSGKELQQVYPREWLDETLHVAARCEFAMSELKYNYPRELVPADKTAAGYLCELTQAGLERRWPQGVPAGIRATVDKELSLINHLGYEHFFLTVHEIVNHAREQKILCQGRGSAANSVVCYALGITEVSPERASLLFERFLSKERNEPPDIDVDFEHDRREEVMQHIYEKYGRERAALAATVIRYRTRSAIRDVGKALGLETDILDRIAKSHAYWDDLDVFRKNLEQQGLVLDGEVTRRLCSLVGEIKGFPRHLSQHVGGFVIAEEPISDLVPIENAAMTDRTVIQWDKDDLESLGLLKVDVLALGMLSALRRTFALLEKAGLGPTRLEEVDQKDDPDTYEMICRADTIGVFQIESRAQMSMLPRLRPEKYYDLVIEIAIVRPGPIQGGMVHPYLKRRKNPELVTYQPGLEGILKKTLGVPIFQEQVMQIAITAAGFTPGEADQLRRSMAAWHRSGQMSQFREKLMTGMRKNGYPQSFAEQIFRQIEGFGEYGFPESHSASFALLTYVSSWLKCHRPAAFIAGLINSQPMGFYQPAQLLEQAKRQGVKVLPVDVTISERDCTLEPDLEPGRKQPHAIRLGMRLIKGLNEEDARRIVAARAQRAFESVSDVAQRARLSNRTARALAQAGAFRSLAGNRNTAFWRALGVERLPGMLMDAAAKETSLELPAPSEWEEIIRDYRQMGLSTTRHPLAFLRSKLQKLGISSRRELGGMRNLRKVRVGGIVTHLQHPQTANGVIFASLEDETGINNIIFWPGIFALNRDKILRSTLMVVSGELQNQEGVINVVAEEVEDYSHWIRRLPRKSRDFH